MIEIPYELGLALKTMVSSETAGDYENQELIFILYKEEEALTWEEILKKATLKSLGKNALEECIRGLWVVGYLEWDDGGKNMRRTYELTLFGRRLLDAMLGALFIVSTRQSEEVEA